MLRYIFAGAALGALILAGCGGGYSGGGTSYTPTNAPSTTPTSNPTSASTPASTPQQATVAGSTAFVSSSNSFTLYVFAADTNGVSNCTTASGCTGVWPPYTAPAGTTAPSGTSFTLITRTDGSLQWAYNGAPLYTYVGDSASGQSNGNGITEFGAIWSVARPSGATASPAPTSTAYSVIRHQ